MKPILLALLLLGTPLATGCHPPATIVTDPGKRAYTADQVVVRVNELQNAAIAANANGSLPEATTRTIVEFCVSADQTLAATPQGWQATLTAAWAETKAKLPPITNPAITAAISAVDVVLAVTP